MKQPWLDKHTSTKEEQGFGDLTRWMKQRVPDSEMQPYKGVSKKETGPEIENRPIEPERTKLSRARLLKWIIFLVFILYILSNYYRGPLLTQMGRFLIVEHPLEQADLIVCLMGEPVERGLAAADVFRQELAPKIFIAREELPDGHAILQERGIHYPESQQLLIMMLKGLGIPSDAFVTHDRIVESTFDEAKLVREIVRDKDYRSLIVVTSPTHTRRSWMIFKQVFSKDKVKIMLLPSRYSNFKPENWWKTRKYIKEVILEYQKLIYYGLKY